MNVGNNGQLAWFVSFPAFKEAILENVMRLNLRIDKGDGVCLVAPFLHLSLNGKCLSS